jgi:hypothetical protein
LLSVVGGSVEVPNTALLDSTNLDGGFTVIMSFTAHTTANNAGGYLLYTKDTLRVKVVGNTVTIEDGTGTPLTFTRSSFVNSLVIAYINETLTVTLNREEKTKSISLGHTSGNDTKLLYDCDENITLYLHSFMLYNRLLSENEIELDELINAARYEREYYLVDETGKNITNYVYDAGSTIYARFKVASITGLSKDLPTDPSAVGNKANILFTGLDPLEFTCSGSQGDKYVSCYAKVTERVNMSSHPLSYTRTNSVNKTFNRFWITFNCSTASAC